MTAILKNVYLNVLNDIIDVYNNTSHRTIKMKPIDVKSDFFPVYNEEFNKKDLKFEVNDRVRISKYKNILLKGILQIGQKFLLLTKLKIHFHGLIHLNKEEIVGSFYEKELQKTNQEEFKIKNVIKRKGNKLYVK